MEFYQPGVLLDGITVKTSRTSEQDTGLKSNKPSPDFGELLLQEGTSSVSPSDRASSADLPAAFTLTEIKTG